MSLSSGKTAWPERSPARKNSTGKKALPPKMSLTAELVVAELGRGEAGRDLGQGGRRREHGGAEEDPVHPDPPCDDLPALLQRNTR